MPDVQIHPTGDEATPADYSIPPAADLLLKMVRASFDGSGAAGSFKPCLRIISDAGTIAGEAVADDAVAAGGSADVTWFPRVAAPAAASGASTGVQWFFASLAVAQTIPALSSQKIGWPHFVTSDSSVFSVTTSVVANDTVHVLKAGGCVAVTNVIWRGPATYPNSVNIISDFFLISGLVNSPVTDSTTASTPVGHVTNVNDAAIALTQSVPGQLSVRAQNLDGADHNVTSALYAILWWPNSTLVS